MSLALRVPLQVLRASRRALPVLLVFPVLRADRPALPAPLRALPVFPVLLVFLRPLQADRPALLQEELAHSGRQTCPECRVCPVCPECSRAATTPNPPLSVRPT